VLEAQALTPDTEFVWAKAGEAESPTPRMATTEAKAALANGRNRRRRAPGFNIPLEV
jgi:hypothetical protein